MAIGNIKEETNEMKNDLSPMHPGSNIYELLYTENKEKVKLIKRTIMRKHPETLIADKSAKGKITNLLYFTRRRDKWYKLFCNHYKFYKKGSNENTKILEKVTNEKGVKHLKIHLYYNGTVMLQGKDETLKDFETVFINLKDKMSSENAEDGIKGKITFYFLPIKTKKSEAEKLHGRLGDITNNPKEDGTSKEKKEDGLTESESTGAQPDCQEGGKGKIKNEENTNKTPEATEEGAIRNRTTT